jgi:cation diffusion facilitator family transporter
MAEHSTQSAQGGGGHGTKAIIAALLANLGIAVAKLVGFLLTGASSMLAEALHSVADSGNQAVLLGGARLARRRPDSTHPFGHGSTRFFAAFLVAVVLFTLGALFSLYEGVDKLRHPHEIESPLIAVGILLVAIVLEAFSLRTALIEAAPFRGEQSWWSFIRTTKKPELAVVILEDTAAQLGLVFAFVGIMLAAVTHAPVWDALGTLAIAALLGAVAVLLAIEMHSLLIGEAASPAEQGAIREAIAGTPGIARLLHQRTMYLSPEELLVVGSIEIEAGAPSSRVPEVIDEAESRLRTAVPSARIIYLEPELPTPEGSVPDPYPGELPEQHV